MTDDKQIRQTVTTLRRSGKLNEAYILAKRLNSTDIWNRRSLGWVYYDLAKSEAKTNTEAVINQLDHIVALDLPSDDQLFHEKIGWVLVVSIWNTVKSDFPVPTQIKTLIRHYESIPVARPSEIHSAFLSAMVTASRQFEFSEFISNRYFWFQFSPNDYIGQTENRQSTPSLVERAYLAAGKLLIQLFKQNPESYRATVQELIGEMKNLISLTYNFQHLPFTIGKLQVLIGEKEAARKDFVQMLLQTPGKWYLWPALAETFEDNDPLKISILCKPLTMSIEETFLVKIHENLSVLLLQMGQLKEASTEFHLAVQIRKENGWPLTTRLKEIQNSDWIIPFEKEHSNRSLYYNASIEAEKYLNQTIPVRNGIITGHQPDGRGFFFFINQSVYGKVPVGDGDCLPTIGQSVTLRLQKMIRHKETFWIAKEWRVSDTEPDEALLRTFHGRATIRTDKNHQLIALCNDILIPSDLLINIPSEHHSPIFVRGKALPSFNKNKGQWGWRALELSEISV